MASVLASLEIIFNYFSDIANSVIKGGPMLYNLMFGEGLEKFTYYMTYGGGWMTFLEGFLRGAR
jgi:hypothetical protein